MRRSNRLISLVSVVVMPIESQIVARLHLDSIRCLDISKDVAAKIYGLEVFDRRVCITACVGRSIVSWCANATKSALVYTIDENSLCIVSIFVKKEMT